MLVEQRMGVETTARTWPEPYLQPDRMKDCGYYATAYAARCLGYPDVTAEQVRTWRAETHRFETYYLRAVAGAEYRTFWNVFRDEPERKTFWLGPGAQEWVRGWLADGWIAPVNLHRIAGIGHAAVLLEADDDGVLLMDPIYGHVTEPWGWFLGPGARNGRRAPEWPGMAPDGRHFYGCTFIEAWCREQREEISDGQ